MWKSCFLAIGIFLLILGAETLVVTKFVMADGNRLPRFGSAQTPGGPNAPIFQAGYSNLKREIVTKDWMPWCLLAAGAITVMYTCSVHQRQAPAE